MCTVCLHYLEQAFETLLEEMNLDTVTCANTCITMLCCVTAVGLCKIIEKSVVGASFVFCPERLGPRLDSR